MPWGIRKDEEGIKFCTARRALTIDAHGLFVGFLLFARDEMSFIDVRGFRTLKISQVRSLLMIRFKPTKSNRGLLETTAVGPQLPRVVRHRAPGRADPGGLLRNARP